jgi:hypothetical protein
MRNAPSSPETREPPITPTFVWSMSSGASANASPPMNRLIVNPMPQSIAMA